MSPSERNKSRLAQAYAAWHTTRGGSLDTWMQLCDPSIIFGSLAEGRANVEFTATLRGRDTLGAYFNGLLGGWTMQHFTTDYFVAEGDRVVMVGSTAWTNKATGKVTSTRKVDVWRFNDAGAAIEFFEYYDTAAMIAAATPG